jgi:ATP-dependent RNA helicase DDX23/PRP28
MNEKKFSFDWKKDDDTSVDYNPLYNNRQNNILFGRGTIAGIDEKEQKKSRSAFHESLLSQRRNDDETSRAK